MENEFSMVTITVSEFADLIRCLDEPPDAAESVTGWLIHNFLCSPGGMIPKPLDY